MTGDFSPMNENIKFFSLGESALTVEFGREISEKLNCRSIKLGNFFERNKFPGLIETVPAYASLTIFYDVYLVKKTYPQFAGAFEAVRNLAENALQNLESLPETAPRVIEIPVRFEAESALDLDFVAENAQLSRERVIEIFTGKIYRVYMLGFLPGFAYMGEVDERIAAPRRSSPRLEVPTGSVGIAGRQTGIYSLASPGGWQIIGRTETRLFTPEAESPCIFQAGDAVKFYED